MRRARAGGVHGLLVPISWAHHAPAPGVLDLDGSTAARRDVSRLLAIIADADLGLAPVTDAGQLPAWLRGTNRRALLDPWRIENTRTQRE